MKLSGANSMVQALQIEGVSTIFGYPGAAICPFYDALIESSIRHILTRNEQGAAHAASGYARATGRTGVCVATSGPGATNLITGIATAYMDSIPMVVITGQVESELIGSDSFQEADTTGATSPFTKHNYLVRSAQDLPRIFKEAFYIASSGRPGPVLIDVPIDVQNEMMDFSYPDSINLPGYHPETSIKDQDILLVEKFLEQCNAPIICAGGGVISSNASPQLLKIVEKYQIPVVTTMMGIGAIPYNHRLYLGTLGSHGVFTANYALYHADLVILIGARVGNRAMGAVEEIARKAQIIHIDIDPAEIGKNIKPHVSIVADAQIALQGLENLVLKSDFQPWLDTVAQIKAKHQFKFDLSSYTGTICPPFLMSCLGKQAGPATIITTEVGQNQIWASNHYPVLAPRSFITSGGMGTMGYGLPAAIGAKIGSPEKTVISISGDGSLQMQIQEFGTIKQQKAAVKIVLLNNSRLGMVHEIQSLKYSKRYSQVFLEDNPDFRLLAEAYGFGYLCISQNSQIEAAITVMLDFPGPFLLECIINPDEPTLYHSGKE